MKMQNPFVAVVGALALCVAFSAGATAAQTQSSSGRAKAGHKGKTGMAEELEAVFSKTGKPALLKDFVVAMKDGAAENPLDVPGIDVLFGEMKPISKWKPGDDEAPASGKIIPEPEWKEFSKEISFKDAACRLGDFATPLVASWKGGAKGIKDAKVTVQSAHGVLAGSVAYGVIKSGTVVKKSEAASAAVGAGLVAVSLGLMIEDKNGDYDSKDEKSDAVVTLLSNGELSVRCLDGKDEKGM